MTTDYRTKVYPYALTVDAAHHFLEDAETGRGGAYFDSMAAIVFSAFAVEAVLNEIGAEHIADWDVGSDWETKLCGVAAAVGYCIERGQRPCQSVKAAFKLRNAMAHAKPQAPTPRYRPPHDAQGWIDEGLTSEKARRIYDDCVKLMRALWAAADRSEEVFGEHGHGGGRRPAG